MLDISADQKAINALELIDLNRYPIADIYHGEGAAFLKDCQRHMDEHGWCNFEGFIRPEAVAALAQESNELLPSAETLTIKRTIYQGQAASSANEQDLTAKAYTHTAIQLADDQIPADTLIQRLYQCEQLTDFVRGVQRKSTLYRCADEFQALNVVALPPEHWHAWHYDTTECTVTLLLQAAEAGGEFTFLPNSRTDDSEDTEAVKRLLSGDLSKAQSFSRDAGTLTLFRGGYSLHGVTKVEGSKPRVSAILTYSEASGTTLSDDVNIRIYGPRVQRILAARQSALGSV